MPTPGSNAYDEKLHRLRKRYVDEGHADPEADRLAEAAMRSAPPGRHPSAGTDRAAGPFGAHGVGGASGHTIELRSPAFSDHAAIPPRFAKTDANLSPPLEWSGVPEGTGELALACEDPDAPGGTFTHWLVTGIDPALRSVGEGEAPKTGRVWRNDFGDEGYDGPLPPVGDEAHRYFFRLWALPAALEIGPSASTAEVRSALEEQHSVVGTVVGTFQR